jgi:protease-4
LRTQVLGWVILVACIFAVPVGIFCRGTTAAAEKPGDDKKGWSSFLTDTDRLLVLRLYGPIMDDNDDKGFFSKSDTAASVKRKLRKAIANDHIKGILLRINSPGGTVGMSQEISQAITEFRAKSDRPVVVSMGDVTASGGYYIAAGANRIFANAGTLTGSIGVIMHLLNWQETEKKIGLQPNVIKSGQFKDIGSPDRPMTADEKQLLQNIIMDSYDQFVTAVSTGRKMDKEAVKKLADGRIYSGRQAFNVKLVDELGSYDDALSFLQKSCKQQLKLDKDLPVDDGSSSYSMIAQMLGGSQSSLSNPLQESADLIKGLLPMSADPRFNKVPLWILQ